MTTLLFGIWEVQSSIAILVYIILVVCAIGFIGLLWYKFRKQFWAFGVSAVLALLISAFLPLILNEIVFAFTEFDWSNVSPTAMIILDSVSGGAFALVARRILAVGFDVSVLQVGKQN